MKGKSLCVAIALITFVTGIAASKVFHFGARPQSVPRFIPTSSLIQPGYHIYWYRTPDSPNPVEITLYEDFSSAEATREHFESNVKSDFAKQLVELGDRFDAYGRRVGMRGIWVRTSRCEFAETRVRIFWTEGDVFWFVQAPSLKLALEFEQSETVKLLSQEGRFTPASSPPNT